MSALKIKDLRSAKINTKLIQKLFLSALFRPFLQKISSYNLNCLELPKSSQNVEISTKKPLTIAIKDLCGAGEGNIRPSRTPDGAAAAVFDP